jgi:nitrite reductase/ring-hydroxylating ferredoxin subunit
LFEPEEGLCIAGPCSGARLRALPIRVTSGYVLLADEVPLVEPADLPRSNG